MVLHIFAQYLSLYLHIFTFTYRGTHTQAHVYNQHTRGLATTRHRSLVERGRRETFVRDKGLAHKKEKEKEKENVTLVHTGPRELDRHPLVGCGSGFGLLPGYTTLSVRVRASI